jgi:RHS repeat-associated protein
MIKPGRKHRGVLRKTLSSVIAGAMLLGTFPLQPSNSDVRAAATEVLLGAQSPCDADMPDQGDRSQPVSSPVTGTDSTRPSSGFLERPLDLAPRGAAEVAPLDAKARPLAVEESVLRSKVGADPVEYTLGSSAIPRESMAAASVRTSILRDERDETDIGLIDHSPRPLSVDAARAEGWSRVTVTPPQPAEAIVEHVPDESVSRWRTEALGDDAVDPESESPLYMTKDTQSTVSLLRVSPEYLHFAGRQGGPSPGSQTLRLSNEGGAILNYVVSEDISWLSLGSVAGSVDPGDSDDIEVTVNTSGLSSAGSPYIGVISVSSPSNPLDGDWVHVQLYIDVNGGFSTLYSYDSAGNLQRQVRPDGSVIDYEYDSLNRLTRIAYPDGSSVAYGYDEVGNRTEMTDSWGTTYYTYDDDNRLTGAYFPGLNPVQYQYDDVGNLVRMVYPDLQAVSYGYDADNRLTSVTDGSGTTRYGYDPDSGQLLTKTLPNGVYTTYGYDADGRLTDVINRQADDSLISSYHYTLDANGNRTSVVEQTATETLITTYGYDELDRLIGVAYPDGRGVTYEYDALGNRLVMTDTVNGVTHYTYDADNRLLQAGDEAFLYDANGNLVRRSSPAHTVYYAYDYENRLVCYDDGENVVRFAYDGDGNRIAKIVNGDRTNYVNDVNGMLTQVLLEADEGWYIDRSYTLGLDRIGQVDPGESPFYYLYDSPLRSVTALVDPSGALAASYDYDAFGAPLGALDAANSSFLYDSEQYDAETGLIYLRNRYYEPGLGRFISRDPFPGIPRTPQTLNPFVYVNNNPVNFVDPLGLVRWWDATVAIVGIIGNSAGMIASSLAIAAPEPFSTAVGLVGFTQSALGYQYSVLKLSNAIAGENVVGTTPSGIGDALIGGKAGKIVDLGLGLWLGGAMPASPSPMLDYAGDFDTALGAGTAIYESGREITGYLHGPSSRSQGNGFTWRDLWHRCVKHHLEKQWGLFPSAASTAGWYGRSRRRGSGQDRQVAPQHR